MGPEKKAGSHRASYRAFLLCPIPEPDDGGGRLGVEGSAGKVVRCACLQQNHWATVNLGVLWGNCQGEQGRVSSRCS